MLSTLDTWRTRYGITILLPLILLTMIMMRMVWIDLRGYSVTPDSELTIALTSSNLRPTLLRSCIPAPSTAVRPPDKMPLIPAADSFVAPLTRILYTSICRVNPSEFGELWLQVAKFGFSVSVLCSGLLVRIISGSWLLALVSAVTLYSRGRLLAELGVISPDIAIAAGLSAAALFSSHYLRSHFLPMLWATISILGMISLLNRDLFGVFAGILTLLVAKAIILRFPRLSLRSPPSLTWSPSLGQALQRVVHGGQRVLGRSGRTPPLHQTDGKMMQPGFWHPLSRVSEEHGLGGDSVLTISILILCSALSFYGFSQLLGKLLSSLPLTWPQQFIDINEFAATWMVELLAAVDLHFGISLLGIVLAALLRHPYVMPAMVRISRLLLVALIGVCLFGFVGNYFEATYLDLWNAAGVTALGSYALPVTQVIFWFEPIVLSLGIVTPYYLFCFLEAKLKA